MGGALLAAVELLGGALPTVVAGIVVDVVVCVVV